MATNTTPNTGLRYPDGSETPNVPLWLSALAGDIDAKFKPWTITTPILGSVTLGNGSTAARHAKIGSLVHSIGRITLGTTSVVSSTIIVSLPFAVQGTSSPLGTVSLLDASAALTFPAMAMPWSGTEFAIRALSGAFVGPTIPFTWAAGDVIGWNLTYDTPTPGTLPAPR